MRSAAVAALAAAVTVLAPGCAARAATAGCPVVAAHKGYHWPYGPNPENSLAAVLDARNNRVAWVETDVVMSRDGRPVIMHDGAPFTAVTGRAAPASGYTYAQLTGMRLRTHAGAAFTTQRVPSMAAYLAKVKAYGMHVEIEVEPWWTAAEFGTYIRTLKAYGAASFARVSGTSPADLAAVRRAYPGIRTDLLVASFWPAPPTAGGSVMEDAEVSYVTAARAALLARQRTALDIWTPDTAAPMRKALSLHPAMITTDDLRLFRRLSGCLGRPDVVCTGRIRVGCSHPCQRSHASISPRSQDHREPQT